jgi:S1-C subfamily serine protease
VPAVNASVHLLGRVLPAVVHLKADIPATHPSARILGTERMGSGTIIDTSGLILTVNYVVLGAREVTVTLLDQQEHRGRVVKHDFRSGLGLVQIDESGLPALPMRPSSTVKVGDDVFILASIGGGQARLSTGNVSVIGPFDANWEYVIDRGIMTTAMNPGLGGGPLLNSLGHVLGVVSLNLNEIGKFSFAIPSEYYLDSKAAFLGGGTPGMGTRAWLGVFCYSMNNHVVVAGVLPGGPGEQAGLKAGDVILGVDDREVPDRATLYRYMGTRSPGQDVALRIFRGSQARTVTISAGDVVAFFA